MRAFFHPYWPKNPYQPLLRNSLRTLGVEVEPLRLVNTGLPKGSVLHLHWLPSTRCSASGIFRMFQFVHHLKRQSKKEIRIIWTAHNVVPHESRFRIGDMWITKSVARIADAVIAHSTTARQELIGELGIHPQKVHVIHHGNYIGHYQNKIERRQALEFLNLPNDKRIFLFLGYIRPYKGLKSLLSAFSSAGLSDSYLVIAGQPAAPEVDREIQDLVAGNPNIRYFPGFVPDEELQYFFKAADVVVFPYENILTSGAVVLAMSFGKACIAPRLGAIPDYLDDSGGFLYDDVETGLLSSLQSAAESTDLTTMGDHNAIKAEKWDWASIARQTLSLYTSNARQCSEKVNHNSLACI